MYTPAGAAVGEPAAVTGAVSADNVVLCDPGSVVRKPPGNSVKRFHNLRNLGGVKFYDAIQVADVQSSPDLRTYCTCNAPASTVA